MRFIHRRLCHSTVMLSYGSQTISNKRGFLNCKPTNSALHVNFDDDIDGDDSDDDDNDDDDDDDSDDDDDNDDDDDD